MLRILSFIVEGAVYKSIILADQMDSLTHLINMHSEQWGNSSPRPQSFTPIVGDLFDYYCSFIIGAKQFTEYHQDVFTYFLNRYPTATPENILSAALRNNFLLIPTGVYLESDPPPVQSSSDQHPIPPRHPIPIPYPDNPHFQNDIEALASPDYTAKPQIPKALCQLEPLTERPNTTSSVPTSSCIVCGGPAYNGDLEPNDDGEQVCTKCIYTEFNRKLRQLDYTVNPKVHGSFEFADLLHPWESDAFREIAHSIPDGVDIRDTVLVGLCPFCFRPMKPTFRNYCEFICTCGRSVPNFDTDNGSELEEQAIEDTDITPDRQSRKNHTKNYLCILPYPEYELLQSYLNQNKLFKGSPVTTQTNPLHRTVMTDLLAAQEAAALHRATTAAADPAEQADPDEDSSAEYSDKE